MADGPPQGIDARVENIEIYLEEAPKLTLRESIERDIAATPAGHYAVVCIPLQYTDQEIPETRYIANREEACAFARTTADQAATYTQVGFNVTVGPHFEFRRYGIYDDSGKSIEVYIAEPTQVQHELPASARH